MAKSIFKTLPKPTEKYPVRPGERRPKRGLTPVANAQHWHNVLAMMFDECPDTPNKGSALGRYPWRE